MKIITLPLCAGLLLAQPQTRVETQTTTTKNTWNGTLVDAACQNTRTVRKESHDAGNHRTVTTTTRTEQLDCPVTTTTSAFGLMTSDGRYIRFDDMSNARVIDTVKKNRSYDSYISNRTPMNVRVIGTENGDVAVVESLDPQTGARTVTETQTVTRTREEAIVDVRWHDDRGKLVITEHGVNFENLSDAKHSRSWTYGQIKELKRDGKKELKIEPRHGDSYEFRLEGRTISDNVYNMIGDRIAAARSR